MALIPWRPRDSWWDPLYDLDNIQKQMNSLFNLSLSRFPEREAGLLEGAWNPAMDIYDSKDSVLVKVDIPGMKKEDIDISVHGNTLIIKGEKRQEREVKEKNYVRTERFYGAFNRAATLPAAVDAGKVQATYKNGVLELVLPKKEDAKPKQIKVDVK